MMPTLQRLTHEHHERITHHVDEMPAIGDLVMKAPPVELMPRIDAMIDFLSGLLVPHIDAAEGTLYPELERMLQNRHSMTPLKREHVEVKGLIGEIVRLRGEIGDRRPTTRQAVALHRVIFRLHALLKIHLAEEELYLRLIEGGISQEATDALAAAMEHSGIPPA